jgi:uncharacterized membrane protein YgcG
MKKNLLVLSIMTAFSATVSASEIVWTTPPKVTPVVHPTNSTSLTSNPQLHNNVTVTPELQSNVKNNLDTNLNTNSSAISGDSKSNSNSSSQTMNNTSAEGGKSDSASNSTSGSSSGGNQIGGDVTNSTNNTQVRTLFLPSHVVPVAPTIIPGAGVVHAIGACGTLQRVEREQIIGTTSGIIWDTNTYLGNREFLAPFLNEKGERELFKNYNSNGKTYVIGHQPTIISTVLTTGGTRQFGLGGNGSSGAGGSGSAGAGGSTQQMAEHIQLTECIFEIIDNNPPKPQLELDKKLSVTKKINQ